MTKTPEIINGKVVRRWFSRGKARIPIFEDGTIGVPSKASDISRSEYHKSKFEQAKKEAFKNDKKISPELRSKIRSNYEKELAIKNERELAELYGKAKDKNSLEGKHIEKEYVDVPYKYGAYTPNEFTKAEIFEKNQDETTVLIPSKLQITKKQLKQWNNGKTDFKEGDIVKASYGIGNTYTGGELKDFKMLENGDYPTLEGKSKMVLRNEQIEKYKDRSAYITKQEEQIQRYKAGKNRNTGMTKQEKDTANITNPRDVASYYMKKGDFAKAEEVLKDYGLEDERAEFIDGLKPSTAKEYNKYLNSINNAKIEAEDRKEFAENAINKIEAKKIARIQKRAKTEKQKEFETADNQMKAEIERFRERKGKIDYTKPTTLKLKQLYETSFGDDKKEIGAELNARGYYRKGNRWTRK